MFHAKKRSKPNQTLKYCRKIRRTHKKLFNSNILNTGIFNANIFNTNISNTF